MEISLVSKGNKALKSEILSRSSPHFLISHHDLKILNQNWGSMFGDSKQINWEAGNSNLLFLSNFLEMTCSKFPILRLYYLYPKSPKSLSTTMSALGLKSSVMLIRFVTKFESICHLIPCIELVSNPALYFSDRAHHSFMWENAK